MTVEGVKDSVELEPLAPSSVYTFDAEFQGKIAALAMRDSNFMQRVEGLVRPEYFENVIDSHLINIANIYFDKYKKVPGDKGVFAMLIKQARIDKIIKTEFFVSVVTRMHSLWASDISDRDFVIDQVAVFSRHQAVSKAILDSVGHLDLHEFDKISLELKRALDVGESGENSAYSYGEMIGVRTEERLDRAAGKLAPTGITTGFPDIDKVLYHKGWGKRELSVLMGGPKSGKTTAMIDFGISACGNVMHYNVAYVTLEVSAKIIADRLDSNISERAMFELGTHIHDVNAKVSAFMAKAGRFDVYEFPSGTMRVSDLRRALEQKKAQGIVYDLVIVDYADLMAPERYTESSTENSKSVYVSLRGLAMEEDLAILTATQTNREGSKKIVSTMSDVAEDFNKIRIADIIISLNQTDAEKSLKQARFYFVACRNQRANFSIRIAQDIDRMKYVKEVIGEE